MMKKMMIIKNKLRNPPSAKFDELFCACSRVLLYSTQTLTPHNSTASPPLPAGKNLFRRVFETHSPSIVPTLDQWVKEGRAIDREDLHKIIKQLRKFDRYRHALQICQWMNDKMSSDVSHKDVSVQLGLISKVQGLKKAEEYFDKIPNSMRVWQVYGALLSCYADSESLEKAEATLQKMRELGYFTRSGTYNCILDMYSAMGEHEKLELLMEEMEQKGIPFDTFTYNIILNMYVNSMKIDQMEKLLLKMEADANVTIEWHTYAVAAKGYSKSGEREKTLVCLKKFEDLIRCRKSHRKPAYEVLLTVYASLGRKDDVYRIWNLYKNIGNFCHKGYLCMMSSLAKLDCLDDAIKMYEEYESRQKYIDYRILNFLITAYCKKGFLEKAESLVNKLIESGNEPNASTWSRMAWGYANNDVMDKAVEAMKKSILRSSRGWRLDNTTLSACLNYLDGKGDIDGVEEIIKLLQDKGRLSERIYNGIVKNLTTKIQILS